MRVFIFLLLVATHVFSQQSSINIPKETYFTYNKFIESSVPKQSSIQAPSHWIKLQYLSPLIGKFQINDSTILSISSFSGSIGNKLSNLNRWRRQLTLSPVTSIDDFFESYEWDEMDIHVVAINNSHQYFLIYWLIVGDRHIFNKVVSNTPINKSIVQSFIESQSWKNI
ncbi:hypothetical protein DID73_01605 [Candidatus Marinamargulisbacteria bacterium SCGC AG-343-K17]|nr:hypothetical protein DID73_01605 [Candidatus Marinamargulisbacteria bacterium SCGC AG-343-K17]